MHKFLAVVVVGMLASTALVNSASSAPPRWQYGWWQQGPGNQWGWAGSWGHGGRWVRHGPNWVYRSRPPHRR
jgi:hypothetical protein